MLEKLRAQYAETQKQQGKIIHRVHFLRTAWFRVAVAVLIIVGLGTYLWNQNINGPDDVATKPVPVQNDVLPGGNKATLTLSDGRKVELANSGSGVIDDAGVTIRNDKGELRYEDGVAGPPSLRASRGVLPPAGDRNTMSTPRGGQYKLILPDGSRVWLNAESSITFPTVFNGNRREVKMTGEVFFEITPDKQKPFIVNTGKDRVEVLGTSFNINAYPDEIPKISLVEGVVKIGDKQLTPGQAYTKGKVVATNLEQDVAWKNGAFNFQNMDTEEAFRQLGRWYDVDVRFTGKIPSKLLGGEIGRDLKLSQVLIALEDIGMHTKLEGNTLVVLPEQ